MPFKSVNLIDCEAINPEAECKHYEKLLEEKRIDSIVMGIVGRGV